MLPDQPVTTDHIRPVRTLGNAFIGLYAAGVLLIAPQFLSAWAEYGRLAAHLDGTLSSDEFWGSGSPFVYVSATLPTTWPAVLVLVAATVVLLAWVWRARQNAAVLTPAHRFRFSPGFAAGGLLIPFANIWLARPILEEIWTASRPANTRTDSRRPVRVWWWCLLAGLVVSVIGWIATPIPVVTYGPGGDVVSGDDEALSAFLVSALVNTVLIVLAIVGVILLAAVVREVSRWQTDRTAA